MAANAMAVSMMLSRFDFCNSCLWRVPSQQLKRLQLVKHSHKNCHSYTEKRTHYPCLKRAALVADQKANRSQDHVLGIQMLGRYGTGVLAGTHSAIYPCTIPSLISTSLRIQSATDKHTKKSSLVSELSLTLPPSSGMAYHKTIREADSSATFRRRLKTHLFSDRLFLFSVCSTHLPRNFSMSSQYFSCPFSVYNLLQLTEHSSQWNHAL